MKGVTHFLAGICVASSFPAAVRAGAAGNPLYFLLGGAAALLPDTLDFKCYRYFYPTDILIVPDPARPDGAHIAARLARAVTQAARTGKPVHVRLSTIRLPGDAWLPYRISLDRAGTTLTVAFEPPCDSGGNPTETALPPLPPPASVALPVRLAMTYETAFRVDIMDGPALRLWRSDPDHVACEFIPWHRAWSHSLFLAGALAAVAGLCGGAAAALLAGTATLSHLLLDQLGHMGSALHWPFSRRRLAGWRRCHSAEAWPNLATVWLCLLITGMNLARFDPVSPVVFNPLRVLIWGALIPLAGLRVLLK